jgi:hypothetical protein
MAHLHLFSPKTAMGANDKPAQNIAMFRLKNAAIKALMERRPGAAIGVASFTRE